MLFDLRSGRRRNVVKVVYATLAVLMGLSLFLVIGGFNIAELFNSPGTNDVAGQYEDEAERIEKKLRKDPEDSALLLRLTRARTNAASGLYDIGPREERLVTPEAQQQLRLAADSWEKYLDSTDEPAAVGAQLMAPTMITLAENSRNNVEANEYVKVAVEAAEIAAKKRPNLNSLSIFAFYTAFLDEEKAERIADQASKFLTTKFARQSFEKELERFAEIGKSFQGAVRAEEQQEAQAGAGRQALENPLGGASLGGTAGGG
ncbi:MAG TPA: hypothetical protein VFM51_02875 [Solirubrobacterales bacterium]|nr:hypothetical protein [Solirubrobacterales bacterium]